MSIVIVVREEKMADKQITFQANDVTLDKCGKLDEHLWLRQFFVTTGGIIFGTT
jgi:hypothetical protein